MDICHLYDYEYQARRSAREYAKENCGNIKRIIFNNSSLIIWTEDENVHHFMGSTRYSQWNKGRTYMLSDGTMMYSGYPISEPKMCCNCLHCARWKRKNGIETHCDLTDKYLGYLEVMDEDNDCKHWEKETKWDLQREHDAKVRADAIEEVKSKMISFHTDAIFQYGADIIEAKSDAFDELRDWLKEQKDD